MSSDPYIQLAVDVFDKPNRRLKAKRNITVERLTTTIQDHYQADPGDYALIRKKDGTTLLTAQTLDEAKLEDNEALRFERRIVMPPNARRIVTDATAYVVELATEADYPILWQPAFIGRSTLSDTSDMGGTQNRNQLAIKLDNDKTVSRTHAAIIEENGQYFLETATGVRNPPQVDGTRVLPKERHPLKHGSFINIGDTRLQFRLETKPEASAPMEAEG